MLIARALTQMAYTLETLSEEHMSFYHATARRLGAVAAMYHYWAKQTWELAYNNVKVNAICFAESDIDMYKAFISTNAALITAVENLFAGIVQRDKEVIKLEAKESVLLMPLLRIEVSEGKWHPGVLKVTQAFVGNVLGVEGESAPEGWFCSTCGSEAGSCEEQCAICGGGSNQIGELWDL